MKMRRRRLSRPKPLPLLKFFRVEPLSGLWFPDDRKVTTLPDGTQQAWLSDSVMVERRVMDKASLSLLTSRAEDPTHWNLR